jgi:hypothetical protein
LIFCEKVDDILPNKELNVKEAPNADDDADESPDHNSKLKYILEVFGPKSDEISQIGTTKFKGKIITQ